MEATEAFRRLMALPEHAVPLDEAALLIGAHADPRLDLATELSRLDRLAEGCAAPTLDALVRHLFADLGFRGNVGDYYNPANSYLHLVMSNRRGIPISLSVLTMAVGRRLGIPLAGVGMPGHFLLRDLVDPTIFVDPFRAGRLLDVEGCAAAFHQVQGDDARFDERYLEPVGTFSILARMLANLRAVFAATSDRDAMVWVMRLRVAVPGTPVEERAELAGALAVEGDFRGAARELDVLADRLGGEIGEGYARDAARLRARLN